MSRIAGQIISKGDIQLVLTSTFVFVITLLIPLSQSHISWRYVVRDSTSLQHLMFPWSGLFSELPSLYLLTKNDLCPEAFRSYSTKSLYATRKVSSRHYSFNVIIHGNRILQPLVLRNFAVFLKILCLLPQRPSYNWTVRPCGQKGSSSYGTSHVNTKFLLRYFSALLFLDVNLFILEQHSFMIQKFMNSAELYPSSPWSYTMQYDAWFTLVAITSK